MFDQPAPEIIFKTMLTPEALELLADEKEKKDMLDAASTWLRQTPPPGIKYLVMSWNKVITMAGSLLKKEIYVLTNKQFEQFANSKMVELFYYDIANN